MDIIHLFISDILLGFIFYGETKISDHPIKAKKCFLDINIYIQWAKKKVVEMTEQHRRDHFNAVGGARAFYEAFELFRAKPGILLGIDAQLCTIFPFLQGVIRRDVYIDKYIDMLEILCDDKEEEKVAPAPAPNRLRAARERLEAIAKTQINDLGEANNMITQLRDDCKRLREELYKKCEEESAPALGSLVPPEPAPVSASEPALLVPPEPAPVSVSEPALLVLSEPEPVPASEPDLAPPAPSALSLLKEEAQLLGISNIHIRSEPALRRLVAEARADTINYREYTTARLQELTGSRAKTKSHLINTLKNLKGKAAK